MQSIAFLVSANDLPENVIIKSFEFTSKSDSESSYNFIPPKSVIHQDSNYNIDSSTPIKYSIINSPNSSSNETSSGSQLPSESITRVVNKFTVNKDNDSNNLFPQKSSFYINGSSLEFDLTNISYEPYSLKRDSQKISYTLDLGSSDTQPSYPATTNYSYFDTITNSYMDVNLNFESINSPSKPSWGDDFVFDFVVSDYNSLYYSIGDVLIPNSFPYPNFVNYQTTILKALNLSPENHYISSAIWTSDVYYPPNSNSASRNARISGSNLIYKWSANYSANISLPSIDGYTASATYTYTPDNTNINSSNNSSNSSNANLYTIKAEVSYILDDSNFNIKPTLGQNNTTANSTSSSENFSYIWIIICAVILILLNLLCIWYFTFYSARKKKRLKEKGINPNDDPKISSPFIVDDVQKADSSLNFLKMKNTNKEKEKISNQNNLNNKDITTTPKPNYKDPNTKKYKNIDKINGNLKPKKDNKNTEIKNPKIIDKDDK